MMLVKLGFLKALVNMIITLSYREKTLTVALLPALENHYDSMNGE